MVKDKSRKQAFNPNQGSRLARMRLRGLSRGPVIRTDEKRYNSLNIVLASGPRAINKTHTQGLTNAPSPRFSR